jgi:hypothetical protein
MSVEYRLTLAADIHLERLIECTFPEEADRPTRLGPGHILGADLYERRGYFLSISSGRNGYYDADGNDGHWEWEPKTYSNIGFSMDADRIDEGTKNMLTVVARALACESDDAALTLNGNLLLLSRFDGKVCKHNRAAWWDRYDFANRIILD